MSATLWKIWCGLGWEEVYKNKVLREEFRLRGDVKFGSHLNLGQEECSMEETMQEMTIDKAFNSCAEECQQ